MIFFDLKRLNAGAEEEAIAACGEWRWSRCREAVLTGAGSVWRKYQGKRRVFWREIG